MSILFLELDIFFSFFLCVPAIHYSPWTHTTADGQCTPTPREVYKKKIIAIRIIADV